MQRNCFHYIITLIMSANSSENVISKCSFMGKLAQSICDYMLDTYYIHFYIHIERI